MIVVWNAARMGFERKSAKRAGEPRQFEIKLLGMAVLGIEQMAQRSESGIDGVQKPEAGDLTGCIPGFAGRSRRGFLPASSSFLPGFQSNAR